MTRAAAIVHWAAIEDNDPGCFRGTDEMMSRAATFGDHFGLQRLGINHMRLEPGRRTSLPHAESHEEEFVYVIAGRPDVWLDGNLHRLGPGDAVGFPPGTGLAHSFLNNSDSEVRLMVVGDTDMAANRIVYPINPERKAWREDWWHDAPRRALGPHDGVTDLRRGFPAQGAAEGDHEAIIHWRQIEDPAAFTYDNDDEPMCIDAPYSLHFRFQRLGIHHIRIEPGHRTSFPHAESAEEEFVYVLSGAPDVWLDGDLHALVPGDAVGFPPGTGLAHTFLNNSDADVELLVVGDRRRAENRIFYPVNPERKPLHSDWWEDHPIRPLGPHDGQTDMRRGEKD